MEEKPGQSQGISLHRLLSGVIGAQVFGDDRLIVPGLAYHTSQVVPGGVFVALRGKRGPSRCGACARAWRKS